MNIFLIIALGVLIYMTLGYVYAIVRGRNDIVDVLWGGGFILIILILLFTQQFVAPMIILSAMVCAWGLRLMVHIGSRDNGKEDYRYAAWRNTWLEHGKVYFYVRSFFQIFILQGIMMMLIATPLILLSTTGVQSIPWYALVGIAVWGIGFYFETVGDWQLKKFIQDKNNKGKIMKHGLWKYTRHPNYFGEIMQWWGIAIYGLVFAFPLMLIGFISPLVITYLLLYVSGIPMLEKKWENNAEFQEYKKETPALVPWCTHKNI